MILRLLICAFIRKFSRRVNLRLLFYAKLLCFYFVDYQAEKVYLRRYIIIDNSGKASVYHLPDHYYSRQDIVQLMKKHGFNIQDIWSDLTGKAYKENTKCLGVAVQKRNSFGRKREKEEAE